MNTLTDTEPKGESKPKAKGRKPKPTAEEPIEKQLWKAADKLRKNIDAAEYKHIVPSHDHSTNRNKLT
jgi:hypothetical protein